MKPFFICEAGINHHGSFKKALRMIELAKEAGANAVKFQHYDPIKVLGDKHPALLYAMKCQFTKKEHELLAFQCGLNGIEYMCSVFDVNDIPWVNGLVNVHKIATRMNSNEEFIIKTALNHKDTVMSIQPHTRQFNWPRLNYMWCVNKYPSTKDEVLNFKFDDTHGLSSHCPDWTASLEAVKRGARILEHHVCESRNEDGCDIPSSLTFDEYKTLLQEARRFN